MKAAGLRLNELRAFLDPQKALRRILMASVRATGARSGSFMLINPNTGMLDIEASHGLTKRAIKTKLKVGEGITGWVASTGKPRRIDDVLLEPKYVSIDPRIRSELTLPVEIKGHVVGVIILHDHRRVGFSPST